MSETIGGYDATQDPNLFPDVLTARKYGVAWDEQQGAWVDIDDPSLAPPAMPQQPPVQTATYIGAAPPADPNVTRITHTHIIEVHSTSPVAREAHAQAAAKGIGAQYSTPASAPSPPAGQSPFYAASHNGSAPKRPGRRRNAPAQLPPSHDNPGFEIADSSEPTVLTAGEIAQQDDHSFEVLDMPVNGYTNRKNKKGIMRRMVGSKVGKVVLIMGVANAATVPGWCYGYHEASGKTIDKGAIYGHMLLIPLRIPPAELSILTKPITTVVELPSKLGGAK